MSLEAGKRFSDEVEIQKKLFLSKDTFELEIVYIPIDGEKTVMIVPLIMKNKQEIQEGVIH